MSDTAASTLAPVRVVPVALVAEIVEATNNDLAALRAELAELEAAIRELGPETDLFAPNADAVSSPDAVAPTPVTSDVETLLAEAQAEAARRLAEAREQAERILAQASAPAPSAAQAPAPAAEPVIEPEVDAAIAVAAPEEPVADEEPVATASETPEFWAEMDSAGEARHRRHRSWRALVGPAVEVLIVLAVFIAVLLRLS